MLEKSLASEEGDELAMPLNARLRSFRTCMEAVWECLSDGARAIIGSAVVDRKMASDLNYVTHPHLLSFPYTEKQP